MGRVQRTVLRLLAVAAVTVATGLAVVHLVHPPWHHLFDLTVYRGGVRWWLDGRPLYDYHKPHSRYGFTYPPFAVVLMTPLAVVPQAVAAVVVVGGSAALVTAGVGWLVAPVARRAGWTPWFAVCLTVPVAFLLEPIRETLGFGQVNVLIAALVLVDLIGLRRGRRWAGVGIGLATAVKLTPGIFVLYLLLTRRWRAAGTAAATSLAVTLAAAVIAPGSSRRYWGSAVWDTDRVGSLENANDHSMLGALARAAYPGQPNRVLWLLLVAVVLVVSFARARRAARAGDDLVGFTLTGLAGCLVSPITWGHHLVWLVPALVVLLDVAAGARPAGGAARLHPRTTSRAAGAAAVAVAAISCSSLPWYFVASNGGQPPRSDLVGALGQDVYVFLLLALVAVLPARGQEAVPGPAAELSERAARGAGQS